MMRVIPLEKGMPKISSKDARRTNTFIDEYRSDE